MHNIIAYHQGQLIPVEKAPTFYNALKRVLRYWDEGQGHEYFVIQSGTTGLIEAELVRPPQGQVEDCHVRYPNGVKDTFKVRGGRVTPIQELTLA